MALCIGGGLVAIALDAPEFGMILGSTGATIGVAMTRKVNGQ